MANNIAALGQLLRAHTEQDQNFRQMVANLGKVSSSSGLIMNDQLQVVQKRGCLARCRWILLCLLRPFYALVGRDVYSHYRVNQVADAIFNACDMNKALLKREPQLREAIQAAIPQLARKIKSKYADALQGLANKITQLTAPKVRQELPSIRASQFTTGRVPLPHMGPASAEPTHAPADALLPPTTPHPAAAEAAPAETPAPVPPKAASPSKTPKGAAAAPAPAEPGMRIRRSGAPADAAPVDPRNLQLKWPAADDLAACGVAPEQAAELKNALDDLVPLCLSSPQFKLRFVKTKDKTRELQLVSPQGRPERTVKTPLSLEVVYRDGQLQDIFLLTKYLVAKGGETNVRLCFSLFHGSQVVRKNCFGQLQRQLLEHFRDYPARGIVPIIGIRESRKGDALKVQSLETFCLGNLGEFVRHRPIPSFERRLQIARDILHGVVSIHNTSCDQYVREDGSFVKPFKMFHLDLTLSNILLNSPDIADPNQGYITDFGGAHPENIGGTAGFKAPEQIELCRKYKSMSREGIIAHNLKFGQASDVWSLGLVLSVLFTWQMDPLGGPPLHCIVDSLQKAENPEDPLTSDKGISILRPHEVEDDLKKLRASSVPQVRGAKKIGAMNKVWDAIDLMVRLEPERRISSAEALRLFEAIEL